MKEWNVSTLKITAKRLATLCFPREGHQSLPPIGGEKGIDLAGILHQGRRGDSFHQHFHVLLIAEVKDKDESHQ